ncbi:MAG: hypothetical protein AUJ21_00260 [Anaerolineae bacterium CG1_02_58_13]|nr:MAG: hypothetical protein AUJ21_00260 [Anaerolineae bacterium CG1_02_58_13]
MMTYRLLFHTAITEIRLTLRNPGFWLFLLFTAVLTSAVCLSTLASSPLVLIIEITNNVLFFQFPLLAIVISPAVTRHRSLSREWVWATRLDYPVLLIGQFIGLTVVFFIASLLPLLMMSFWIMLKDITWVINLPALWAFGLIFILPVTFLEMCVAFSFACWFRNTVLVIGLVTALDVLLWLGIFMPDASLLTPLNHTLLTLHLDSVAGLGAEKPILASLLLFYVFLGAGGVMASIGGSSQVPSYGESQPTHKSFVMLGMFVGCAGIFLTFWLYTLSVKQSIVPPPPLSSQIDVWGVESAFHNGSISGAEISLQSEFILRNVSDVSQNILILSLNTGQNLIEATVNEYSVSFKRAGETIEILLPSPAAPNGVINVKISYAGSPILLREDYSLQTGIQNDSPPSFQNPVQTYLDGNVAYLHRDGDWMAWPLSSKPHLSPDEVIILEVPKHFPIAISGEIIEQTDTYIKYQWKEKLPQILLATAPYQTVEQSGNMVFLGRYSDKKSLDNAQTILALAETLDKKINPSFSQRYTAVALPYVQEVVMSNSIIGLPNKDSYFPDDNSRIYDFAKSVTYAWLIDRISWPGEITSNGYLRGSETICDMPDETGHQKCETISPGKHNLQAPYGRLVNKTSHNPLLNAISAVLAWQLAEEITGSDALTQREYEKWAVLAECDISAFSSPDKYQTAGWIMSFHDALDKSEMVKLIQVLMEKYPIGSPPITEDEFLQIARNYENAIEPPLPCETFIRK